MGSNDLRRAPSALTRAHAFEHASNSKPRMKGGKHFPRELPKLKIRCGKNLTRLAECPEFLSRPDTPAYISSPYVMVVEITILAIPKKLLEWAVDKYFITDADSHEHHRS